MASKTPPVRGPFFEFEATVPAKTPTLPGMPIVTKFLRTTREWAEWASNMARGVGQVIEQLTVTASLNFPLVAANGGVQDLTVTVDGVKAADVAPVVKLGIPAGMNAGLVFHAWVSADDTVTVRCTNTTAGGINPAAADFRVVVERFG